MSQKYRSQSTVDLVAALMRLRKKIQHPKKTKTAKIKTRSGSDFSYQYADLKEVVASIDAVTEEFGIHYDQSVAFDDDGRYGVFTYVYFQGQWKCEFFPVDPSSSPQEIGAAITFGRRYTLCVAYGVIADEDTDAQETRAPNKGVTTPLQPTRPISQPRAPVTNLKPAVGSNQSSVIAVKPNAVINAKDIPAPVSFSDAPNFDDFRGR